MSNLDDRGKELQQHHNQGEKDASEGKYDPPHDITPLDIWIQTGEFIDHMKEDNDAYHDGRDNANKQK